ncbi:class I SAM-dependent methyltransferase [Bacillus shivajii]|uniref:class I SAM-dependent methyltransferase n=1 Tax=Bacillus shivajii TaxID=1983719 RepID=UPI001CFBD039|nr:class I SAM-dependent methyltransferase [Bacillus shivajii]UCZ52454.1 class I SAM-dependent methyltransferase [Bacillus shivajii]
MNGQKRTTMIQKRYDRIAPIFNMMDKMVKEEWRKSIFSNLSGKDVLEVGVGTGANLPYYPKSANVTAIDFSPKMLTFAKRMAKNHHVNVELIEMDAQNMTFPDQTFDAVVTTCVFCSVPDPIAGLTEIRRVLKDDGELYMLEHMRSDHPVLGKIMDLINPLVVGIVGANINRKTMENLQMTNFEIVNDKKVMGSVMRELQIKKA